MTEKEYKEHIDSVVFLTGLYVGKNHTIKKSSKTGEYIIYQTDGYFSCPFPTIEEATAAMLILEPLEEIDAS
jgi:hypothetical protein